MSKQKSKTLFDKLWDAHLVVAEQDHHPAVLYIDLHLLHEVTSPQAFAALAERGQKVRRPDKCIATADHSVPTLKPKAGSWPYATAQAKKQVDTLAANCSEHGIRFHNLGDAKQGIVHVIGPELGLTQPGRTIVCGDSHTSTHGAFGGLAFGIGTSEVGHVLATQCLLQRKPKTMAINFKGKTAEGVTAKDMILAVIAKLGTGGGTGHVLEYRGEAVRALDMEARMTLCNMSIEAGARAGMVAADETTFAYLKGREFTPQGADFDAAVEAWRYWRSDAGAQFDREISIDASAIQPMITYGTHPGMAIGIDTLVPEATTSEDRKALEYMGLEAGQPILGKKISTVFIGSCTNGRLSDLRAAAKVMRGQKVAAETRMLVVPGSREVKNQAEAEGLHEVFLAAGAEWREPGCSMCIAMNGDQLQPGEYAVSTSNRNFEGRQGKGGRTFLASPATAAVAAIHGSIADPRPVAEATV